MKIGLHEAKIPKSSGIKPQTLLGILGVIVVFLWSLVAAGRKVEKSREKN